MADDQAPSWRRPLLTIPHLTTVVRRLCLTLAQSSAPALPVDESVAAAEPGPSPTPPPDALLVRPHTLLTRGPGVTTRAACPAWCITTHGQLAGADDEVHVGGALQVRRAVLRLCSGSGQEPYLLVGDDELTLYEAEALAAALAQLVDAGRGHQGDAGLSRATPGTPTPGP